MSAFVAIVRRDGAPVDAHHLQRLTAGLRYRAPGGESTWCEGIVGLGFGARPTTHEARSEQQPCSLDGQSWIAGDIRVDAREDLVRRLGLEGRVDLAAHPDSHLLLAALDAWGERGLDDVLGDFSFARWDARGRRLFAARDRFGLRSLFYAELPDELVVSNSLHAIRCHPAIDDTLCETAMADFFATGDQRMIDRTLTPYAAIRAVPAGQALSFADGRTTVRRWWDGSLPSAAPDIRSEAEGVDAFRDVLQSAVRDRMRNAHVSIALSGGMDASAIAALATESRDTSCEVRAYTVVWDRLHVTRERAPAKAVAEHLGLPIEFLPADDETFRSAPPPTTRPMEVYTPGVWAALHERVSAHGGVLLTGEAGDNCLHYVPPLLRKPRQALPGILLQAWRMRRRDGRWPTLGTGLLARTRKAKDIRSDLDGWKAWIDPDLATRTGIHDRFDAWLASWSGPTARRWRTPLEAVRAFAWDAEDTYRVAGGGCEMRDPYLDPRVLALVQALPSLPYLHRKHVLRTAMEGRLPSSTLERPKELLGWHHAAMLLEPDAGYVDDPETLRHAKGFFQPDRVPRLAGTTLPAQVSCVHLRAFVAARWMANPWRVER